VLEAAEREGVRLPEPGRRFERSGPEPPAPVERPSRATLRDSPLADLFRQTG
jgi:hypothetical protein